MKIAITGGTGFIAKHLTKHLISKNHELTILSRSVPQDADHRINWCVVDYQDVKRIKEILNEQNVLFHLASSLRSYPIQSLVQINESLTEKLVIACNQLNSPPKFVLVSSQAAGGPAINGKPRDENDPSEPISIYGLSKYASEKKLRDSQFWWTIQRPPAVFGPEEKDIMTFIQLVRKGVSIQIGKVERKFSWIYVQDLVLSLEECIEHDELNQKLWYVRSGDTTWEEFSNVVSSLLKNKPLTICIPEKFTYLVKWISSLQEKITHQPTLLNADKLKELRFPDWRCDDTFFRKLSGWTPRYTLTSALEETIEWLLKKEIQ